MMPEKPKFPKCAGYKLKVLQMVPKGACYCVNDAIKIEKALSKAEQTGAKAERERILEAIRIVCGEFDDEEAYAIEERLKAESEVNPDD